MSIRLFKPFDAPSAARTSQQGRTQEIIHYGESRFRQALLKISVATRTAQAWMQKALQIELVSRIHC